MHAREGTTDAEATGSRHPLAGAIGVVAGLWLFASALLWPNEHTASYNALMIASVIVIASMGLAEGQRAARWVLGASGSWVIVSLRFLSIFDPWAFEQGHLSRRRLSPKS